MRVKKNTIKVWDEVWSDVGLDTEDISILEVERATIRWSRIKTRLSKEFGNLKNLKVIEIGSGIGTYAALLASEGAKSTLLDYSPKALKRAKEFFKNNKLKAEYVLGDALDFPQQIKKNGIAIIIVPNKYNPPYRIYKFISEFFGTWKFGEEYPYSRKELKDICINSNHELISIFASC
ncbi:class I SAM-dependent methyltransferase [Patescibacteria group bacterium]|nr:class I SAM-dependent methyltransferase [Patescibacteria group bacterium]